MQSISPYKIFALGDSALSIDFGNKIDPSINAEVISLFHFFKTNPLPGIIETIPAYSSLTIYYDFMEINKKPKGDVTAYLYMKRKVEEILKEKILKTET